VEVLPGVLPSWKGWREGWCRGTELEGDENWYWRRYAKRLAGMK